MKQKTRGPMSFKQIRRRIEYRQMNRDYSATMDQMVGLLLSYLLQIERLSKKSDAGALDTRLLEFAEYRGLVRWVDDKIGQSWYEAGDKR